MLLTFIANLRGIIDDHPVVTPFKYDVIVVATLAG